MGVSKQTLLERIEYIAPDGRTFGAPIKILFDELLWEDPDNATHVESGLYEDGEDVEWIWYMKPCSSFGVREELVERLKASKREEFTEKQLAHLFRRETKYSLGGFEGLGGDDFFMKMNRWYYCSYGGSVFEDEAVPTSHSTDQLVQLANAALFHRKVRDGEFGRRGELVVQKWGSGGILPPVLDFVNAISRLDEVHRTKVYNRLRYEVSDMSKKSISEAAKEAKKYRDVLRFKTYDVTKPLRQKNIACIESSYLFDSISQPILSKVDGKFYNTKLRPYLDMSGVKDECPVGFEHVIADHFISLLKNDDYEGLSRLSPEMFANIEFEHQMEPIDMESFPYGKDIEELMKDHDNLFIPAATSTIEIILKACRSLRKNGYFQTFDLGITDPSIGCVYARYNGAIYTPLHFPLIKRVLEKNGLSVRVESLPNHLANVFGNRKLPMGSIMEYTEEDPSRFKEVFPYEMLRNHKRITELAEDIEKRYLGYSEPGREAFSRGLKELGVGIWGYDDWTEGDYERSSYISDFRDEVWYYLDAQGDDDHEWISEEAGHPKYAYLFKKIGFKKGIIRHIFKHFDEIAEDMDYFHMCVHTV